MKIGGKFNYFHFLLRFSLHRKLFSSDMPTTEVSSPVAKVAKMDNEVFEVTPVLNFAKLTENAFTPTRGSEKAAGFDLYRLYTILCMYIIIILILFSYIYISQLHN